MLLSESVVKNWVTKWIPLGDRTGYGLDALYFSTGWLVSTLELYTKPILIGHCIEGEKKNHFCYSYLPKKIEGYFDGLRH